MREKLELIVGENSNSSFDAHTSRDMGDPVRLNRAWFARKATGKYEVWKAKQYESIFAGDVNAIVPRSEAERGRIGQINLS